MVHDIVIGSAVAAQWSAQAVWSMVIYSVVFAILTCGKCTQVAAGCSCTPTRCKLLRTHAP